ncbi:MAG: hypothetical protein DWQ07_08010 [Chloroflexi bacterium]|nr:MAG: hypothetical protein DWQ07_08010 [Chloroflexota bacterium]MBL1197017.1 hypothetical protein [Chloroflexota bacterium]NOH14312.1 hypothetical protein [Chloroflexota bacterium]
MVEIVNKHGREAHWDFEGVPVTVRTTRNEFDGMINIHIQAFAQGEDDNPPGFHIGVEKSVLEKYGEEGDKILLMLVDDMEDHFVSHYLFKFSKREQDGYVPSFAERVRQNGAHA